MLLLKAGLGGGGGGGGGGENRCVTCDVTYIHIRGHFAPALNFFLSETSLFIVYVVIITPTALYQKTCAEII